MGLIYHINCSILLGMKRKVSIALTKDIIERIKSQPDGANRSAFIEKAVLRHLDKREEEEQWDEVNKREAEILATVVDEWNKDTEELFEFLADIYKQGTIEKQ